jgi:ribosomal protein S27E
MKIVCQNCITIHEVWLNENGESKIKCQVCGSTIVVKIMSRRHIKIDIFAPERQQLK